VLISYTVVKRIFLFSAVGGGVAVLTIFLLISIFGVATQNYAMNVDPIKDNQYLFSTARVTVTNTGKLPLTNIVVNYGSKVDKLTSLSPGENAMLSPPENSTLKSVTVTADHGLSVTKDYRTPLKIPGMMGS
jgi:hypothetical protein